MDCCDPGLYDRQFDEPRLRERLREYRRHGPRGWTRRLIAALSDGGVEGRTVLDIGGGVGAVHHELLAGGAASAVAVDASGASLAAARSEAERRGWADRVRYVHGDAVAVAHELPAADLVALDRVVCCYPDMPALVAVAATRTRRRLGLVLPYDLAPIRAGIAVSNAWSALRRDPFRVYAHRVAEVMKVTGDAGLVAVDRHHGLFWETIVFERPLAS